MMEFIIIGSELYSDIPWPSFDILYAIVTWVSVGLEAFRHMPPPILFVTLCVMVICSMFSIQLLDKPFNTY